ncbi:MAG: EVE domain-containing protein [Pirellulaceae bacterium]|nr:EVE domain-containing protein [Pirellulaceae bacterium]
MNYWLLKTEPETFSIDDLACAKQQTTCWDGVRNYQARNFMRDQFRIGDIALLYHSNDEPPGIVGTVEVVRESYPDVTAFDRRSKYFDEGSTKENPRWVMVDVRLREKFSRKITLEELKAIKGLDGLELLRRGSRLSVQPVSAKHFAIILKIAQST